jgi:dipeptidase E
MCELGWKSLGVLELTALPGIKEEHWIPEVEKTDALLVLGRQSLVSVLLDAAVDFSLFPHLERENPPDTSLANIERWAAGIPVPAYAIDDQTAIKVVDGNVEVVSEGYWKLFTPRPEASESG